MVTISSEFLADLRQLLLTPSNPRWTLHCVEGYFKCVGKRHAWLSREQAMACASMCQQFTENWRHGWKKNLSDTA